MSSKEARAYNWAIRIVLKNLIGEQAFSFNQYIASDEEAIFFLIREIIDSVPCFSKAHHRLDKFHLL